LGNGFVFKDAAMFGSNNPALLVIREAGIIPEFRNRRIGCLLSLGTGLGMLVSNDQPVPMNTPAPALEGDFVWRTLQRFNYWMGVPRDVRNRCQELCSDLVAVATNAETKDREVAGYFKHQQCGYSSLDNTFADVTSFTGGLRTRKCISD
jgi:hypothetical protein